VDEGGTHAGDGTVLFINEQAGVSVSESDVAVGGDGSGQVCDEDERVLIVTLKDEWLAVRAFDFFYNQIGVKLDANGAGSFKGFEINFCSGGNGLTDGVESGGNVVVIGEEIRGQRELGAERRGGATQKEQREHNDRTGKSSAKGHRTPFKCIQSYGHVHL